MLVLTITIDNFFFLVPRNYDPGCHHFEGAREYVRALNATKLERVFAKPFIGSLDGHRDAVSCIGKHPKSLSFLVSGAYDGEVKVWDIPQKTCIRSFAAHEGIVRGITFNTDGENFITVGDDKIIRTWNASLIEDDNKEAINTMISKTVVSGISHNRKDATFVTSGEICQLWDETRNEPIKTYKWGVDSLHDVAFNPIETNLMAACASDRSIILYDTRDSGPLRKIVMKLKSNKLCWNPMEAFIFTCANEDYK